MKNLGPKSEEWLPRVGIHNPEQLRASDPYEIYAKLKASLPGVNLNALYALIGAIEDRHWLEVKAQDRTEILLCLDQLGLLAAKSEETGEPESGVIPPGRRGRTSSVKTDNS